MTYAYRMNDAVQVANQAATDIEAWLWRKSETISVSNDWMTTTPSMTLTRMTIASQG